MRLPWAILGVLIAAASAVADPIDDGHVFALESFSLDGGGRQIVDLGGGASLGSSITGLKVQQAPGGAIDWMGSDSFVFAEHPAGNGVITRSETILDPANPGGVLPSDGNVFICYGYGPNLKGLHGLKADVIPSPDSPVSIGIIDDAGVFGFDSTFATGIGTVWVELDHQGNLSVLANGAAPGGPISLLSGQATVFNSGDFNDVRLYFDTETNHVDAYVNGVHELQAFDLDSVGFDPGVDMDTRAFAIQMTGYGATVDNFLSVPEPASIAPVLLGSLAALSRRRSG